MESLFARFVLFLIAPALELHAHEGERATVIAITDEQLIPVPDFDFREEEGAEQDNLGVVGKVRA